MGNHSCCSRDDYLRKSLDLDLTHDCTKGQRTPSQGSVTRPSEGILPFEAEKRTSINAHRNILSDSSDSGHHTEIHTERPETVVSIADGSNLKIDSSHTQSRWCYANKESVESAKEFNDDILDAFVSQYDQRQQMTLTKRIRNSSKGRHSFDEDLTMGIKNQNALALELGGDKYWPEQQFGRAKGIGEEKEDLSLVEYDYDLQNSNKYIKVDRETFQAVLPVENQHGAWGDQNSQNIDGNITPKFTEDLRISGRLHDSKRGQSEETIEFSVVNGDLLDNILKSISNEKTYKAPEIKYRSRYEETTSSFKSKKAVGYNVIDKCT